VIFASPCHREYTRHINIHQRNVPRSCRASRKRDRRGSSPAARSRCGPALGNTRALRLFRFTFIFYSFFHSSSSSSLILFNPFVRLFYLSLLLPPFLIFRVSLSKIIIIIIIIIIHAHYSYVHALQYLNLHTLYKRGQELLAIPLRFVIPVVSNKLIKVECMS